MSYNDKNNDNSGSVSICNKSNNSNSDKDVLQKKWHRKKKKEP